MNHRNLTPRRLTAFLRFLRREERAPATIEKYSRDVQSFWEWLGDRAVTKEEAAAWKTHLLGNGLSPATVNAKLSALNSLFRFLGWADCRVKFIKIQHRAFRDTTRELTREEFTRLLGTAQKQGRERLGLLMETISATGIRVGEVKYITLEAARFGRAEIRLKGKVRVILLPGKLCRKLLKFARKQGIRSGQLFLSKSGGALSRKVIWQEMKSLCRQAGVEPSKVFPHNLRHLFAIAFYRATRDIVKLADVLGHSSVETTRVYLMTAGREHQQALDRLGFVT